MPLQQLCSSSGNKRIFSSDAPFISPSIHTQEVYDAKLPQRPMERCSSQTSTLSFSRDICRICHCEGDSESPLIAPCYCAGSLRFVHQGCLQQWVKSSDTKCCELCKFPFIMHSKVKPFRKWERLDLNGVEKRKILFSVMFHIIAITCVVWSLYVLIERTSQEVQNGELEWPFWTKLIVVAIGFTGSVVFMYVQCKMYIHLCKRWRAFNRVIYIQNAPEKMVRTETQSTRVQSDMESSPDKPFVTLAVITTSAGMTTAVNSSSGNSIVSATHGRCYATSSSPPPCTLWTDDNSHSFAALAPDRTVQQSFRHEDETETLNARSDMTTTSYGDPIPDTLPAHDPRRRLLKETRHKRTPREDEENPICTLIPRNSQQQTFAISSSSSSSMSDLSDLETERLDTSHS